MTDDTLARRLAERASQPLEPIYDLLGRIAAEVLRSRPPRAALTEGHFSGLQRMLADLLRDERGVWGMGFIAAPFVVEGRERYLAWWQRHDDRVARLRLNFDPTSIDVYDYLQMDWYQLALHGQQRVAYGPYVDYSGSDMYTSRPRSRSSVRTAPSWASRAPTWWSGRSSANCSRCCGRPVTTP